MLKQLDCYVTLRVCYVWFVVCVCVMRCFVCFLLLFQLLKECQFVAKLLDGAAANDVVVRYSWYWGGGGTG